MHMDSKQKFYDSYHQKNKQFYKVIKRNNFTYYEILRFFYSEVMREIMVDILEVKMLDIGCGVGTVSLYFASLGADVIGIDISKRAINIAQEAKKELGFKNINFSPKSLRKGRGKYDLVLTLEVIEHIEDEEQFLNMISSHLNNGGLLCLSTPLKENYLYKLGFYKTFDKEVGHLRRYTVAGIKNLLQNNGFTVLKWRRVEGPLRNLLFTTRLGFVIKFIRGPLIPIFHWLDWISMQLFGATDVLVLARKDS